MSFKDEILVSLDAVIDSVDWWFVLDLVFSQWDDKSVLTSFTVVWEFSASVLLLVPVSLLILQ